MIGIEVRPRPGFAYHDKQAMIAQILPLLKPSKSLGVWGSLALVDWDNHIFMDLRLAIAATMRSKSLTHIALANAVNFADARILTSCSSPHLVFHKTTFTLFRQSQSIHLPMCNQVFDYLIPSNNQGIIPRQICARCTTI